MIKAATGSRKLLEPRRHLEQIALYFAPPARAPARLFASCGRHLGRGRPVRRGTGVPRSAFHDVTLPPCSARLGVGRSTSAHHRGFRRGRDEVFRGTDRNGSKVHAEEGDSVFNAATPDNVWRRFRTAAFEVRVRSTVSASRPLMHARRDHPAADRPSRIFDPGPAPANGMNSHKARG